MNKRALPLIGLLIAVFFLFPNARAQVLFDATKAEMAGNADWVIDADAHDLRVSSAADGSGTRGSGTESEPQRVPTPAIGGITSATPETYWQGALSAWAVALAKRGQTVIETLPVFTTTTGTVRSRITYGDGTNAQDLSHYRLFVVCEPNIAFTDAEKTALLNYVKNGGSLFLVADHHGSDRNNDGLDSGGVWNDLLNNNTVQTNPFGFTFNLDNVSPTTEVADAAATNPLTHGAAGAVTQFVYASGATMTVNNANVAHAAVWQTSAKSSSQVMALYGTFGSGRFAAIGDSSPCDDGTGDPGDTLYDGWDDGGGNNGQLITNACLWLLAGAPPTATTTAASGVASSQATLNASVNPQGTAVTYHFDFGTTTAYGFTSAETSAGSGAAAVAVSLPVAGLAPGTTYHFRVTVTSTSGTVAGADVAFATVAFVDTDGDGLPDDYETAHGLDPGNAADAATDRDGDGQSNLAEYLAGTDPANAADALRTSAVSGSGTTPTVRFTPVFGKRYVVERATSLSPSAWSAVSAVLTGNGTPLTFTDAGAQATGAAAVFYRARVVP